MVRDDDRRPRWEQVSKLTAVVYAFVYSYAVSSKVENVDLGRLATYLTTSL